MEKIIILHGWTYDLDKWQVFIDKLRREGFDVKILKVPGLTERSDAVWDVEKYIAWLKKKISEEKQKTSLLGHSNGGRIAIAFATKYPKMLKRLILVDSAGIYHRGIMIKTKRLVFGLAARVGKTLTKSPIFRRILYKVARENDYLKASPTGRKTMLNLINSDKFVKLQKIKTPTLIIWGDKDKTTPLKDALALLNGIKNSRLRVIKGSRHSPFYSHPDEVIKAIKDGI